MRFYPYDLEIRCEWFAGGLRVLAPVSDVIVTVDVLWSARRPTSALRATGENHVSVWKTWPAR